MKESWPKGFIKLQAPNINICYVSINIYDPAADIIQQILTRQL